jgi:hypothetical protein
MCKPLAILLIVALELFILFTGQAQVQASEKQNHLSQDFSALLSVSCSLHPAAQQEHSLSTIFDITIFDILYNCSSDVYWKRPNHNQKQITAASSSGHGVRPTGNCGSEITSRGYAPAASDRISWSLFSMSPLGLILRL